MLPLSVNGPDVVAPMRPVDVLIIWMLLTPPVKLLAEKDRNAPVVPATSMVGVDSIVGLLHVAVTEGENCVVLESGKNGQMLPHEVLDEDVLFELCRIFSPMRMTRRGWPEMIEPRRGIVDICKVNYHFYITRTISDTHLVLVWML